MIKESPKMLFFTNNRQILLNTPLQSTSHQTPTLSMHFKFISRADSSSSSKVDCLGVPYHPVIYNTGLTISDTNFVKKDIITCNLSKGLLLKITYTHSCVQHHK